MPTAVGSLNGKQLTVGMGQQVGRTGARKGRLLVRDAMVTRCKVFRGRRGSEEQFPCPLKVNDTQYTKVSILRHKAQTRAGEGHERTREKMSVTLHDSEG